MVFSSPLFIFLFLPFSIILYFITPKKIRNYALLFLSLGFYAFGEGNFIFNIIGWILINYFLGIFTQENIYNKKKAKLFLLIAVIINLSALFYFKYLGFFLTTFNINNLHFLTSFKKIYLPLAISFLAFHTISYQVDIYRQKAKAEKNPFKLGLYFLFFPHLLAGPIIRYHLIANQFDFRWRATSAQDFSYGVERFITGLGKKVLIADTLSPIVDEIFAIPPSNLTPEQAWLGALGFMLQIYFDFSGYSDMAIGMARFFGFKFPENFNYPYIATSLRDFWTRWHITLSNWFRDYLYIPLGGNRISEGRTYFNLFVVFIFCGFWHGANWTFLIWGILHGLFLILERLKNGIFIKMLWGPLRHIYVFIFLITSWVFFRADSLSYAFLYLQRMFGILKTGIIYHPNPFFLRNDIILALTIGSFLSLSFHQKLLNFFKHNNKSFYPLIFRRLFLISVLLLSMVVVASSTFKSFIYFRF